MASASDAFPVDTGEAIVEVVTPALAVDGKQLSPYFP